MIHMLCRFDLRPGIDEAGFLSAYAQFIALLKSEGLIQEAGAVGKRLSDTPMDTDEANEQKYYSVISFRDRGQLDKSYARFKSSMSGHEAVLAGICNSFFTCWKDLPGGRVHP